MNQFRRFRKNKDVTKNKVNKIKSTTLKLSLIMLNFIFATFAWFTYTMILDPTVDVSVSAWQIHFKDGETLGTNMDFTVGTFYPGMDDNDYVKNIEIVNLGDRAASVSYEIENNKLKILGQEYEVKEIAEEGDSERTLYKSEVIDEAAGLKTIKLLNNSSKFPFEIILKHSIEIGIENPYDAEQNKGHFEIRFTWPYEITELPEVLPEDLAEDLTDEEKIQELNLRKTTLDTKWGYDIANFYNTQPEGEIQQGIEITLQVIAKQII